MACPYFQPGEPDPEGESSARPRPPLGRFYNGRCLAGRCETPLPLERCNLGYARGLECFPADSEADAIRFSVADDGGDTIAVRWCIERDHRPVRWGTTNWSCSSGRSPEQPGDTVFNRQLTAYAQSYLTARDPAANG